MSYEALETSRDAGAPVELYEFTLGAEVWRFTSADADQSYDGHTWTAVPLSRGEIDLDAEVAKATLQITAAVDFPIADLYREAPPTEVVLLRIRAMHRGDGAVAILWLGRLVNCEWSGREAVLSGEPLYTSIRQPGLRRFYSRLCPHVLYGTACRLGQADWGSAAAVLSVGGLEVVISGGNAGQAGYFAGGMLAWTDGQGRTHRRGIESHGSGNTLRLISPIPGLAANHAVTLWPGCDHTLKACRDKFGNNANFGGFKWIPGTNPFSTAVF